MDHRHTPRRRYDDHGNAIGEAEERSDARAGNNEPIGARIRGILDATQRFGVRRLDVHQVGSVYLVGHDERHIGLAERTKERTSVSKDDIAVVANMSSQVKACVIALACPSRTACEGNTNRRRVIQRVVGENRNRIDCSGSEARQRQA